MSHRLLPESGQSDRHSLQRARQPLLGPQQCALPDAGRRGRPAVLHPQKVPELLVAPVEDDGRVSRTVLALREPRQIGRMVVRDACLRPVEQPQSTRREPVARLDVLPGRKGKRRVEGLGGHRVPVHRQVRRVEEVERHVVRILDQGESELESLLVDVVEERSTAHARVPVGAADDADAAPGLANARRQIPVLDPPVRGQPSRRGDGVVTEKGHPTPPRRRHAPVARYCGPLVALVNHAQRGRCIAAVGHAAVEPRGGAVAAPVVDDEDLEARPLLGVQRIENLLERGQTVERRDDHTEVRRTAHRPTSMTSSRRRRTDATSSGHRDSKPALSKNCSSPGYVGTT